MISLLLDLYHGIVKLIYYKELLEKNNKGDKEYLKKLLTDIVNMMFLKKLNKCYKGNKKLYKIRKN